MKTDPVRRKLALEVAGTNANRSPQQMFSQMISDKVTVTVNENEQAASDAAAASQIAKFQVKLISARKDAPHQRDL